MSNGAMGVEQMSVGSHAGRDPDEGGADPGSGVTSGAAAGTAGDAGRDMGSGDKSVRIVAGWSPLCLSLYTMLERRDVNRVISRRSRPTNPRSQEELW
ncbi:hypothetical protein J6590_062870 [Homalodisca vitripennis]|nr:hypothetical protein J6590_062870 [Homalodisca vitripennis]